MASFFIGGNFSTVGALATANIAKWSGTEWVAVIANGTVNKLVKHPSTGDIYAVGAFTELAGVSGNVMKFDGSSWTSLGGAAGTIYSAAFDSSGNLYVVGSFTSVGGVSASNVAKWNGSAWSSLSSSTSHSIADVAVHPITGDLYVCGYFNSIGGVSISRIAKWDGSTWAHVGDAKPNTGVGAAVFDASGNFYVGGSFSTIGGSSIPYLAKWNGSAWVSTGHTPSSDVVNRTLLVDSGWLYFGTGVVGLHKLNLSSAAYSTTPSGDPISSVSAVTVIGADILVGSRRIDSTSKYGIATRANRDNLTTPSESWSLFGSADINDGTYVYTIAEVTEAPVVEWTVSFDADGGSPTPDNQTVTDGGLASAPDPAPTKAGYTLSGWYTTDPGVLWNFASDTVSEDTALTALWLAGVYTATFNSAGGTAIPSQTGLSYGDNLTEPSPRPSRAEASFTGWYKEPACENLWDFAADTVAANVTLYAGWNGKLISIVLDTGAGKITIRTRVYGLIEEPSVPTRTDGYVFDSWCSDPALTKPWDFDNDTVYVGLELYAKWTMATFTVTFNTNGGSAVADQAIVGGKLVRRVSAPTKAGYTFYGWYKEAALTNPWMFPLDIITANTTLYAKWVTYVDVSERIYVGGTPNDPAYFGYPVRKKTSGDTNRSTPVGDISMSGTCHALATTASGNIAALIGSTVRVWDGSTWETIADIYGAKYLVVNPANGDICVAGSFVRVTHKGLSADIYGLARWDGATWAGMGGVPGVEYHLALGHDGVLYRARESGSLLRVVEAWDGTSWGVVQAFSIANTFWCAPAMANRRLGFVQIYGYPVTPWVRSLGLSDDDNVANSLGGIYVSSNGVLLWRLVTEAKLACWDGTAVEYLVTPQITPIVRFKFFGTGKFYGVCSGKLVGFTDEFTYATQGVTELNMADMCIAMPINTPTPDDPDNPVEPEIPDPPTPEDGYTFKSIVFNIVSAPHVPASSYQIKPITFNVIETLPCEDGYCYKTFYFDVGAFAPPIDEKGVTSKLIIFDVYGTGEKIPGDEILMDFSVEAAEDQPALISFNVIGTTIKDFPVSFYVNEEIEVASLDMDVSVLASGAIITGGNKSVLVNIFQGTTLIATADGFARVGAGAGLRVGIYDIPNPLASDILVEAYVQNELTYSETLSYSTNLGVTIV